MKFHVGVTGLEVYHDDVEIELSDNCRESTVERMSQMVAISTFGEMLDKALQDAGFKTREKQTEYYARLEE
jgi:hypothetical protein